MIDVPEPAATHPIQVVTTVGNRAEADEIAARLVGSRLAACVQIVGPITSVFHWKGAVETSEEWLCVAKTTADRYPALERQIRAVHSYELPEIIALPIVAGLSDYLTWIAAEVGSTGAPLPGSSEVHE
jgi:periplasmic divalent cation tolerance protein